MARSGNKTGEDDYDNQVDQNHNNHNDDNDYDYDRGHEDQDDYDDPYNISGGAAGSTGDGAVRFPAWVALAVLSVVGWIALLSRKHTMNASLKWSLAITTLSMLLGIICVLCHLFARGLFISQPPEIIMVRTFFFLFFLPTSISFVCRLVSSTFKLDDCELQNAIEKLNERLLLYFLNPSH